MVYKNKFYPNITEAHDARVIPYQPKKGKAIRPTSHNFLPNTFQTIEWQFY